jgi:two-component system cell cycle response regulator CtrA
MHILLVAGDDNIADQIEWMLVDELFNIDLALTGAQAIDRARQVGFDVILLDPRLPDATGHDLLNRLRQVSVNAPVVIVSDQSTVDDMSRGFGFGAQAYVVLPAEAKGLVASIYRACGRARKLPFTAQVGDFRLEFARWLKINGERVALCGSEQRIVELLVRRRGETISTAQLCERLYGRRDALELPTIEVFVSHARQMIKAATGGHSLIETVWGQGYRLAEVTLTPESHENR